MNFTIEVPKENDKSYSLRFESTELIIAASTTITMCVFGTIANVIIIITVLSSKKLRSTFYFLIMSLSVSDLLSALVSILVLYRITWGFDVWHWPDFTCKLGWGISMWTYCVTSFHILMFSLFRFVSLYWLHKFTAFTLMRTKIYVATVWVVGFGAGFIPMSSWVGAVVRNRSRNIMTSQWPSCLLYMKR